MQSHRSSELTNKPGLDFYKLYYPTKKGTNNQIMPSIRSKSMSTVLVSPDNEQAINDMSTIQGRRQIKRNKSVFEMPSQKDKIMKKYRQKILKKSQSPNQITFKRILSPQVSHNEMDTMIPRLPLRSIKDIQQFSSKNLSLKQSIQNYRQQKNKINKILVSHKQSQQGKLQYLQIKKKQVNDEIIRQMRQIYDRYFRKQYEIKYGKNIAYSQYQKNIKNVIHKLSNNIFG